MAKQPIRLHRINSPGFGLFMVFDDIYTQTGCYGWLNLSMYLHYLNVNWPTSVRCYMGTKPIFVSFSLHESELLLRGRVYDDHHLSAKAAGASHPSQSSRSQFLLMRSCITGVSIEVTADFSPENLSQRRRFDVLPLNHHHITVSVQPCRGFSCICLKVTVGLEFGGRRVKDFYLQSQVRSSDT